MSERHVRTVQGQQAIALEFPCTYAEQCADERFARDLPTSGVRVLVTVNIGEE